MHNISLLSTANISSLLTEGLEIILGGNKNLEGDIFFNAANIMF